MVRALQHQMDITATAPEWVLDARPRVKGFSGLGYMIVKATTLVLQGRQNPIGSQALLPSSGGTRFNLLQDQATGWLTWLYVCSLEHISELVHIQPKCRGHPCECACGIQVMFLFEFLCAFIGLCATYNFMDAWEPVVSTVDTGSGIKFCRNSLGQP